MYVNTYSIAGLCICGGPSAKHLPHSGDVFLHSGHARHCGRRQVTFSDNLALYGDDVASAPHALRAEPADGVRRGRCGYGRIRAAVASRRGYG